MTREDFYQLSIPEEFGVDEYSEESAAIDAVMNQLDDTVYVCWGASKFVILPKENAPLRLPHNEKWNDAVIKIPFTGMFTDKYNSETEEYYPSFESYRIDYCKKEAFIYEEAERAGVDKFFAATVYGGKLKDGTSFYLSERVECTYIFDYSATEEGEMFAASTDIFRETDIPEHWVALAYDFYDVDEFHALVDFIKKYKINDLSSWNLGIDSNGAPVIFDYSGFSE